MDASLRRSFVAVAVALAAGFLLTCCVSDEPVRAYRVLLAGALPDLAWSADGGWTLRRLTRFSAVLEDTITLALLGLAVLFGLRARQFSMGADGQLFVAALAAAWVSVQLAAFGALALPAAALAAVAAGFAWGAIPGVMKARWQANEIVTTLMLNIVGIQLYRLVITHAFNDPAAGFLAAPALPEAAMLAPWWPRTRLTAFVLLAPLAVLAAWFVLHRTTLGYEIRAVGDAPDFAARCGMPVARTVVLSMALGGAFAGLAGLHLSNAVFLRLPVELSPGIGFEGLVVALLARNEPKAVLPAALFYAYLKAGGAAMERSSDVSREVVLVIQALIVMCVVCERFVPAALARAWQRRTRGAAA
ncbi:MAG TPA: hypothetical protein VFR90_14240 [Methylibium sp.]|uniref:ABC transporter permease n=1 Tax=Methylibium sp. TaxID=2067992 RepID=UPI002DB8721B|nr:hypothetical protein [Methylibium sp.]HEU4460275.1 hypothetical protein [Methylibium sp.]